MQCLKSTHLCRTLTRTVCWSGDSAAASGGSGAAVDTPLVKAASKPSKRTPLRGASSGEVCESLLPTGVPGSAAAAAAAAASAASARLAA